jgi:hypothetical protein
VLSPKELALAASSGLGDGGITSNGQAIGFGGTPAGNDD